MGKGKQKPYRQAPNQKERPSLEIPARKGKVVPSSSLLPDADSSLERICWRFKHADQDGPWGMHQVSTDDWREIMAKMSACESMTVVELMTTRRLFKDYDVPGPLIPEAVKRLEDLNLGDLTKIHRLEFAGMKRLYGVLFGNVFHVIWWDSKHEICPSNKRNT